MIETERLRLRNWREDDVEAFDRHTNTPAVMRWLGGVRSREQVAELIRELTDWQVEHGFTFWAVERKQDGELLGFCGIGIADDPGSKIAGEHEIGWRLREDAWGQGYAKEAATGALDHAFNVVGASRLVALTLEGNSPSWGLMRRLGFERRPELDYFHPRFAEHGPIIVHTIERERWRNDQARL